MSLRLLALAACAAAQVQAQQRPCDILAAAGNPCVAAHSTVRALYAAYAGALYNVTRASDGQNFSVPVLTPGGFANKAAHDAFCPKLDCVISHVLDQSPMGNHLGQRHKLVNASQHPITVSGGVQVYGMWFDPGFGYHVDATKGIAKGNEEESMYAVLSGKHFNGGCCFDYGNSESDDHDDGDGTMEVSSAAARHCLRCPAPSDLCARIARESTDLFRSRRSGRRQSTSATRTGAATRAWARAPGSAPTSSRACTMVAGTPL